MKKLVCAIFVSFASGGAFATCTATGCTGVGAVVSAYPNAAGDIYLEAPAEDRANLGCTLVTDRYMTLERSHPSFKEIYSTVLTAMVAGKKLQVRITDGSATCAVAYVRMWN